MSLRLAVALLLTATAAAQRPGGFQVIGPGGGGAMYRPSINPHDPQTVLVACDMGGGYISHDAGRSWRMFNLHGAINAFAFDPKTPTTLYAGGTGLWRSTDNGATWNLILPRASKVIGIANSSTEGDETLLSNEPFAARDGSLPYLSAMAIDPSDGRQIYAALGKMLVTTKDGGEHWSTGTPLPDRPNKLILAPGPDGKPELWMSSLNGFWNLHHADHKVASNEFSVPLRSAGLEVVQGRLFLYASSGTRFFRAAVNPADKTLSPAWQTLALPGTGSTITTFATSADGRAIYASYADLQLDGKVWGGVAKSTDDGQHWTLPLKISNKGEASPNYADGWITSAFDAWWGEEPLGLAVAPNDAQVVYATDLGRTMKSSDGGVHWTPLYTRSVGNGAYTTTGLDVLTSYGVYFDPFDKRRMFIGYTDVGLFRSEDGGASWMPSHDGVPAKWRSNTYSVVLDPAVRGRMWATMDRTHDLPQSRMWRRKSVTEFSGSICESTDGGKHWRVLSTGLPDAAFTHLNLDPKSPADRRTLYAVSFGHGVYKSTDGGQTWQLKGNGVGHNGAFAWRMALAADGTLYLVVVRESGAPAIQNSEKDGAMYRSRDGAEHWERVALPAGVNGPMGLSVDPHDPAKLYLAAWARPVGQHGEGGGIYGSRDGGAHWQLLFAGEQHVYDITRNTANPSELYATGFSGSAWRSTDEGAHWKRIAGFNFKGAHRVIADPVHPGQVYITTFGGGVWHGAGDGASGVEDVAGKELAPR